MYNLCQQILNSSSWTYNVRDVFVHCTDVSDRGKANIVFVYRVSCYHFIRYPDISQNLSSHHTLATLYRWENIQEMTIKCRMNGLFHLDTRKYVWRLIQKMKFKQVHLDCCLVVQLIWNKRIIKLDTGTFKVSKLTEEKITVDIISENWRQPTCFGCSAINNPHHPDPYSSTRIIASVSNNGSIYIPQC